MAKVVRPAKVAGGTALQSGTTAYASDMEGDFQALQTAIDDIDNTQINSSAGIDPDKIDDASTSTAESREVMSMGTTEIPVQATDLQEELKQLRYGLNRIQSGIVAKYMSQLNAEESIAWQEPPIVGPNLIPNAEFDLWDATNTIPYGWTRVAGAPDATNPTISHQLTTTAQGEGFEVTMTAGAAEVQGIKYTLEGLKASTKYLIGAVMSADTNDAHLFTAGAEAGSTAYQDFDFTTSSATLELVSGIVMTRSAGEDVVVSVETDGASGDVITVSSVFCYELGDNPIARTGSSEQAVITGAGTHTQTFTGTIAAITGLDISAVRSSTEQKVYIDVIVTASAAATSSDFTVYLKRDATTLIATAVELGTGASNIALQYIDEPPVGGRYAYTVAGVIAPAKTVYICPVVNAVDNSSTLTVEVR